MGRPQNLVSYHLGKLRSAGLVVARRSSADGRDAYYTVALDRFSELLAAAGRSLHPGLQLPRPPHRRPRVPLGRPARLLFLCTGNSARSQIAEALAVARSQGRVEAFSAGSHPKPMHPMQPGCWGNGASVFGDRRSKPLSLFAATRFDHVITLCDKVREVCPEFPGHPGRSGQIHWSIPDPAASGRDDQAILTAFRQAAAELDTRIGYLLAGLGAQPGQAA